MTLNIWKRGKVRAAFRLIAAIFGLVAFNAFTVTAQAQFTYSAENGEITITRYTGSDSVVTIPSMIDGLLVTRIGDNSFYQTQVVNVLIPDGVTRVGSAAFNRCTNLVTIVLPGSITSIGRDAFSRCTKLGSVAIPNSVTNIETHAFSYCVGLTNVTIPNGVDTIGDWAFSACTNLAEVTLPDSLTYIGYGLFNSCSGLTNVTMGNSVMSIGDDAFRGCSKLTSITIPDTVMTIGDEAFAYCSSLAHIATPKSLFNIKEHAFSFCTSLVSVTIPAEVAEIGRYAFIGCTNLSAITVDAQNPFYTSVDGVLFDRNQTILLQYPGGRPGGYVVSDSVTMIGEAAFYQSTRLTHVAIPASVTHIGGSVFYGCMRLTSVTIPESIRSIGDETFSYCDRLTGIYFKGNPPSVNSTAFNNSAPIIYYLPETTGWESPFVGRPAVLWNPDVVTDDARFGVQDGQFGFNIRGTTDLVVVVEACPDLANPVWTAVGTNVLTGDGLSYFSDPDWSNHPSRIYRLRSL